MKRAGVKFTKRTLLLLYLSIAFAMSLALFWGDDSLEHAQVSEELITLKELDARLDRDVLRITSFLLSQYDSLVQTTSQLKALEKKMRIPGQHKYEEMDNGIATYWRSMNEKLQVLERIKFQAAVVRNGIHYLPLAAESLKNVDLPVYQQVIELLNNLYVYDLFYSDSQLEEIKEGLARLEKTELSAPESQLQLENVIFHIRANLDDLSSLGELKRHYLKIPSLENFEKLHSRYEQHRIGETRRKQTIIVSLSLVVFLLMLGLWYLVRSLHLAHHAVNQSWNRLHDAVDSLSEAFALFDADSRLVLFNRRYAEIYPWLKDWLYEGVDLVTLRSVTGNRIQFMEAQGRRLHKELPEGR